jgi:hypothetical protein
MLKQTAEAFGLCRIFQNNSHFGLVYNEQLRNYLSQFFHKVEHLFSKQ